jgi:hypothetical protein
MADPRSLIRRLNVLKDEAEQTPVPTRKFFAIGNAGVIEGYGETLPLLSWIDDNLSRFVIANAPSTSWGRVSPAPFIYALPNIPIKPKDGIFLVTGPGADRTEPNPSGEGELKIVFLNSSEMLWSGGLREVYIYRLDGLQKRRIAGATGDGT